MPELTRQVYRMPKAGSIGHLNLQSESLSEPGPQEVRIAVQAIGLNFADIFAMWGLYSATPQGSFIPGLEYAGVIEAVGPGSTFQVGDRVMAVIRFGGYASHINADQRYVIPLPAAWDMGQGAAFLLQVLT
ncbi:MAG: alcohol dehydrogenase catalytic domain-containing protein, partial [Bacteroidota bacterium]